MHILLFIIQYPPDVNSTGLLMEQIFEELVGNGHQVTVVTTFPHYREFEIAKQDRGKLLERDRRNGMEVLRHWVYTYGEKQNMANRLMSYLSFNLLGTASVILSRRDYDVAFCTNGSFFTGISAWTAGGLKAFPFVYNVQDLYPEVPIRAGKLRSPQAIAVLEKLERFMYRKAAHVSVITPSFEQNLVGKGVPGDKITVIPNFVDTEFIRPLPKVNDFSRKHDLADRFVVSHAGNIGYAYDLDTMLDAAAILRDKKDILFLIVGEGVAKEELRRQAERLQLNNVRFLPFQPWEDLPRLRASSDVQVSLYKHGSAKYSMPSKVYEIMASGTPILASADPGSDVWNLVEQTGCGICIEPEDEEQIAEAVLRLYRDPDLCEEMGTRGRQTAEAHYSKEVVAAQYEQLLRQVAAGGK